MINITTVKHYNSKTIQQYSIPVKRLIVKQYNGFASTIVKHYKIETAQKYYNMSLQQQNSSGI